MTSSKFDTEVIDQFDKTAESYSKDNIFSHGMDLDIILREIDPKSTMIVLDVATGSGHVALKISPFVKSVYAIDITPKMIKIFRQKLESEKIKNIIAKVMSADKLEFSDNMFDIITCRFATHHFTNIKKFLSEIKRVLKPNGKLILVDIIAPSSKSMGDFVNFINKQRDHTHIKQFSEVEWESIFSGQNFSILNKQSNPLKHNLENWLNRAKTKDEDRKKIIKEFKNSSEAQIQFRVDPKIESFVEDSMIFTIQSLKVSDF